MSDRDAVADRQTTSTNEGSKVLRAITRAQVDEVISLLERLSEARKARAAEDQTK